jgi:hypothetical protein
MTRARRHSRDTDNTAKLTKVEDVNGLGHDVFLPQSAHTAYRSHVGCID